MRLASLIAVVAMISAPSIAIADDINAAPTCELFAEMIAKMDRAGKDATNFRSFLVQCVARLKKEESDRIKRHNDALERRKRETI